MFNRRSAILIVRCLTIVIFCANLFVFAPRVQADDDRFTIDTNLNETVEVTGADLDEAIRAIKPSSALIGLGQVFVNVGNSKNINAYYIAAHAAWETGWGTSAIFKDKNNLFGYGAFDHCPYECALTFNTIEEGVVYAMTRVKEDYLTEGGKYYNGPNLRGMNVRYATDTNWGNGIVNIMNSLFRHATPSLSVKAIRQPNFPILIEGESLKIEVEIQNAGSEVWVVGDYLFVNEDNPWGMDDQLSLPRNIAPGETVGFSWMTGAFPKWGVYTTKWYMAKNKETFGQPVKISVVVLPKQLEEKRKELEDKVKEWGEKQLENIEGLITEWIQEQINKTVERTVDQICNPAIAMLPIAFAYIISKRKIL